MSEINTSSILDAISLALHAAFPDSHIHSEETPQDLIPGDFTIVLTAATQQGLPGGRYRRTPAFDVIYFPKAGKEECYSIADRLFLLLEVITTPSGDKIRGSDMLTVVVDDVLHFQVQYRHYVLTGENENPMETLILNQGG